MMASGIIVTLHNLTVLSARCPERASQQRISVFYGNGLIAYGCSKAPRLTLGSRTLR